MPLRKLSSQNLGNTTKFQFRQNTLQTKLLKVTIVAVCDATTAE